MTTNGMITLISCIGGSIAVTVSVISHFAGQKKHSNDEVAKRARFEGEITAKLDQVLTAIEKLENKLSKNTDELYSEIAKRIAEHEKRYHNV